MCQALCPDVLSKPHLLLGTAASWPLGSALGKETLQDFLQPHHLLPRPLVFLGLVCLAWDSAPAFWVPDSCALMLPVFLSEHFPVQ